MLPPGKTCNNHHFNPDVPEQDEYSLDTKTVIFGEDPYDETLWSNLKAEDSLGLYENKHHIFYVAVEMVIDGTEEIAHVIKKRDTLAGQLDAKKSNRNARKLSKIRAKTVLPNSTPSG